MASTDLASILRGDTGAVARALTLVERREASAKDLLHALRPHVGRAHRVLVTGPPGVGKSSLLGSLLVLVRRRGQRAAVLACDPASPYSNGAFLGDRVRWVRLAGDEGIFIRSIAHREATGGIPPTVHRMADIPDAAGYPWIFLETVGVGQADIAPKGDVRTRLLVLSPGSGDEMQMLKAGLLEGADLYVVNKSDLPGGTRWARVLKETLTVAGKPPPPVVTTVATTGAGADAVLEALVAG